MDRIFNYLLNDSPNWLQWMVTSFLCILLYAYATIIEKLFGYDIKGGRLWKYKIINGKTFIKRKGLKYIFTKWKKYEKI